MEEQYQVKKLRRNQTISVEVPGSKSMTNRALLLASLSNKRCLLKGVLFSDDSRAFLECLVELGFFIEINEPFKQVTVQGTAGNIPNKRAKINVRSAGTAARFLTVMLAFAGGHYELYSSEQMKRRPMAPVLSILEQAGVKIQYLEKAGHFPFVITSKQVNLREVEIDTNVSSQFASALFMSGVLLPEGITVVMKGERAAGSYIKMTIAMMEQFGIAVKQKATSCVIPNSPNFGVSEYQIEPDVSGACYFYAIAPVLKTDVIVKNIKKNSLQGDIAFLQVMEKLGCIVEERNDGVIVKGNHIQYFLGIDIDMKDFSDQTMTMAVVAAFAQTPTMIRNVGHIRFQESDRMTAIVTELTRLGITCKEIPEAQGIYIEPGEVHEAVVETYDDHRMAMAFTIMGLHSGKITIQNPECCAKTFENYFEIIEGLYGE